MIFFDFCFHFREQLLVWYPEKKTKMIMLIKQTKLQSQNNLILIQALSQSENLAPLVSVALTKNISQTLKLFEECFHLKEAM